MKAVAFNAALWACERAVQWQQCMALLTAPPSATSASSFLACASAYQQAQRWQDDAGDLESKTDWGRVLRFLGPAEHTHIYIYTYIYIHIYIHIIYIYTYI